MGNSQTDSAKWPWAVLAIVGIGSAFLWQAVTNLSYQFNWGEGYAERPILEYLFLYFALFALQAGGIFLLIKKRLADKKTLVIVVAFGLLFRALILPSQQIQEDDVYRYLWDGKSFAHGINPFEYAPEEATQFKFLQIRDPDELRSMYDERQIRELKTLHDLKFATPDSFVFMERINHPDVPTIYPPLAQYVFRAIATVRADSILALRLGFLLFDLTALVFIYLTLKRLGRNPNLCMIYFWSPLIVKETFNSTHLDIIGVAFLCASVFYLVARRFNLATFFLALSVLGKIYPVILLPLYLKQMARGYEGRSWQWRQPAGAVLLFVATVAIGYAPFLGIGLKAFEGLRVYSIYWQNNDSLFSLLAYLFGALGFRSEDAVLFSYDLPSLLAKVTVALALGGTLIYLLTRRGEESEPVDRVRPIFIMMALVFLLSPVQNPWYLCWTVPFLCFFPRGPWIFLTGLVGMYYLDFYFDYQEMGEWLPGLPWMEYLPFYLWLGWEFWRGKDRKKIM